jgi:oligoribonuclease
MKRQNPLFASGDSIAFDPTDRAARFVWLDLEMTGLNPDVDEILEIAVVITGADLQPLGEMSRVILQPEETLEHMSSTVRRMHSRNGLIKDVLSSTTTVREAERVALALVVEHCQPGEAVLCGNGIHYDWRFLVRHMPRLEHYLHYRQIDVSTMKILVETWAPKLVYEAPRSDHRALADTHASISELRYYCEKIFRRADDSEPRPALSPTALVRGDGP